MASRWIPRIPSPGASGASPPAPGSGATTFLWVATGQLSAFGVQAGSLAGPVTDLDVAADGPFDAQREVASNATIQELVIHQRSPATAGSTTTTVQFYRLRAGVIVSLGTVSMVTAGNMTRAAAAPAVSDLLAGDIVFVSFVAVPGINAKDLSAYFSFT